MINQSNAENRGRRYIEVSPGVKLHITDKGAGRPVVLLPGLPMTDEIFKHTYQFLADKGYRAIGITLRGFGKSDAAEHYDLDLYAQDINSVLMYLELKNVVLAGYDFGGMIAAYYIAQYSPKNVSQLILVSATVPKYTRGEDYPYGFSRDDVNQLIAFSENNLAEMLDIYGPFFGLEEQFMPLHLGNWLTNINLQTTPAAITQGLFILRDADLRSIIPDIKIPTAIFHAKHDGMVPLETAIHAYRAIPNAEMVFFDRGGHWFFLIEKDEFNRALLQTISTSSASALSGI
jgi:pimeloyl-ACP methyl ester carboxylesterase